MSKRWTSIVDRLENLPEYSEVKIPKRAIGSPLSEGMHRSYGELQGQLQDFRKSLPGNRGFHVREYDKHYTAHIDSVDVDKDILGHVLKDSPATAIVTSAAIGATLAMLTDCKRDALKGAVLGTVAAVIAMVIRSPGGE